jgi:hypothetical protein
MGWSTTATEFQLSLHSDVGAMWERFGALVAQAPLLCRCLRLGVQGEEAHHVMSDREPQ